LSGITLKCLSAVEIDGEKEYNNKDSSDMNEEVTMKKGISLLLVCMMISILTGCSKKLEVDNNTVYVQKKGDITGVTIEKFDKEYYNPEELEGYVDERVAEYLADHEEESVAVDSFDIKKEVVKLTMDYSDYKDYAAFNDIEMFSGTIAEALAEGYDFKGEFVTVKEGKLGDEVSTDEVTKTDDAKVVVIDEKVDVKIDGTIQFVSAANTSMANEDTVRIKLPKDAQDGEEQTLTYIIYNE
jgi:hypothetical protein